MIHIYEASGADLPMLVHLFDAYRSFYNCPSDTNAASEFLHQRFVNRDSVVFIAVEQKGDEVSGVGFTQLYPSFSSVNMKKIWILNDLYISELHRNKGIASQLIQVAKSFAKESGACNLTLETAITNFSARRLYEKENFIPNTSFVHYDFTLIS